MFQIFPITALFFQRARGWIWWNTFHMDFLKNRGGYSSIPNKYKKNGQEELTYHKRRTDKNDFQSHLWFPGCTLMSVTYEAVGGIWEAIFHNTEVPCNGSPRLSRGFTTAPNSQCPMYIDLLSQVKIRVCLKHRSLLSKFNAYVHFFKSN